MGRFLKIGGRPLQLYRRAISPRMLHGNGTIMPHAQVVQLAVRNCAVILPAALGIVFGKQLSHLRYSALVRAGAGRTPTSDGVSPAPCPSWTQVEVLNNSNLSRGLS